MTDAREFDTDKCSPHADAVVEKAPSSSCLEGARSVAPGVQKGGTPRHALHHHDGVVILVPTPSDDPQDPLNWPRWRKYTILAVLCLGTFTGFTSALATQLELGPMSALYGVSETKIVWLNSAAVAGLAFGGLLYLPLSAVLGRPCVLFWSMAGVAACQVWSARLGRRGDFAEATGARALAGFFGNTVGVLGPGFLVELFFLHQRGRAFSAFHFCFNMGNVVGPSLCAFVVLGAGGRWAWAYWWTAMLSAAAALAILLFVPDTAWDRRQPRAGAPGLPGPKERRGLGWSVVPRLQVPLSKALGVFVRVAAMPFKIAVTPVAMLTSMFCLLNFGFYVALNSITPLWLQRPVAEGGYGFTDTQNALFQFFHWAGVILALVYGQLVNDRVPLALARRRNAGEWKPEYRLHALWLPSLVCNPLGLGIFGYALQGRLSWGLLGLGHILVTFGSVSETPITVNYLTECFTHHVAATAVMLTAFRVGFGLSVAFYINPWVAAVGFAWAYGTMAFIQLFSWVFMGTLMLRGHAVRRWDPFGLILTEEGEHVLEVRRGSDGDEG